MNSMKHQWLSEKDIFPLELDFLIPRKNNKDI